MDLLNPHPNMAASGKNLPLRSATSELGLGDDLRQRLEDELANRRKAATGGSPSNANPLSEVVMSLFRGNGGYGAS